MKKLTRAVDWDDTLVDARTQEWLPNAINALKALLAQGPVIIHTCRANWPEGLASVEQKLDQAFTCHWRQTGLTIAAKPSAAVYIDNQALRFNGDWAATLRELATC